MTKTELIAIVSQRLDTPKNRIANIVDAMFEVWKTALDDDRRIELRGFGSLSIRHYDQKNGRNPASGERLTVGKKRSVYFKPGKNLRDRVNSPELLSKFRDRQDDDDDSDTSYDDNE